MSARVRAMGLGMRGEGGDLRFCFCGLPEKDQALGDDSAVLQPASDEDSASPLHVLTDDFGELARGDDAVDIVDLLESLFSANGRKREAHGRGSSSRRRSFGNGAHKRNVVEVHVFEG